MRAVLQRVSQARVTIGAHAVGSIDGGLLVLVGVGTGDTETDAEYVARKVAELRIFDDDAGRMNCSVEEAGGAILVVSQFTLYGDCRRGRRPSFSGAMAPGAAEPLIDHLCTLLRARGLRVERGVFGAAMEVSLVNHGPVTILIDSARMTGQG